MDHQPFDQVEQKAVYRKQKTINMVRKQPKKWSLGQKSIEHTSHANRRFTCSSLCLSRHWQSIYTIRWRSHCIDYHIHSRNHYFGCQYTLFRQDVFCQRELVSYQTFVWLLYYYTHHLTLTFLYKVRAESLGDPSQTRVAKLRKRLVTGPEFNYERTRDRQSQ